MGFWRNSFCIFFVDKMGNPARLAGGGDRVQPAGGRPPTATGQRPQPTPKRSNKKIDARWDDRVGPDRPPVKSLVALSWRQNRALQSNRFRKPMSLCLRLPTRDNASRSASLAACRLADRLRPPTRRHILGALGVYAPFLGPFVGLQGAVKRVCDTGSAIQ